VAVVVAVAGEVKVGVKVEVLVRRVGVQVAVWVTVGSGV